MPYPRRSTLLAAEIDRLLRQRIEDKEWNDLNRERILLIEKKMLETATEDELQRLAAKP